MSADKCAFALCEYLRQNRKIKILFGVRFRIMAIIAYVELSRDIFKKLWL